jgi:FkbM family methyltransferase
MVAPIIRRALEGPLKIERALRRARKRRRAYKRSADQVVIRLQELLRDDVVMRVPEFDGEFWCSPKSHLFFRIAKRGCYEPDIAKLYLSHLQPDGDVIDVGANIGFFTVAAAKKLTTGRVLAIEPTKGAFERLAKNVDRNGVRSKVVLFNGLASDANSSSNINVIEGMEEYSSIRPIVHRAAAGMKVSSQPTEARTIDHLVEEHGLRPRIIKADVEGAEALVFAGAQRTLMEHRPVIIAEAAENLLAGFGIRTAQLIEMFWRINYTVLDAAAGKPPHDPSTMSEMLCIPR